MPVRIYALAKELDVDSKDLVGICTKAGILGKGSALASLTDDEVVKVKAYLRSPAKKPDAPSGAPAKTGPAPPGSPLRRPGLGGLKGRFAGGSPTAPATSESAEAPSSPMAPAISRDDYIGPGRGVKIKVIDARPRPGKQGASAAPTDFEPTAPPSETVASAAVDAPAEPDHQFVDAQLDQPPLPASPDSLLTTQGPAVQGPAVQGPAVQGPAVQGPAVQGPAVQGPAVDSLETTPGVTAEAIAQTAPHTSETVPAAPPESPDAAAATDESPTQPAAASSRVAPEVLQASLDEIISRDNRAREAAAAATPRKGSNGERKPKRRTPVINVAPMPEIKQPAPKAAPAEPKAQEPEIRLPKQALAARKGQRRPPLEHLTGKSPKGERPKRPREEPVAAEPTEAARRGRRGHGTPVVGPEHSELAGMAGSRAERKARRATRKAKTTSTVKSDGEAPAPQKRRTLIHRGTNTAAPRKGKAALELPCTVRSFSEAAGVTAARVMQTLIGMGQPLAINSTIGGGLVEVLAAEFGVELELKQQATLEDALITKIQEREDDPDQLVPRPPIVTFLGHVDHGKTSLLDYLIGTRLVAGEAGGITQHIRAYQIEKDGRTIAFVDTPGHAAFTDMRARGANVTDIAVLVIAADDGIMPQTEEAISHVKAAGVPIIVALNKSDLPGANPTRVMTQMTEHGLTPSQWGGDIEVVPTSAITGQGIDELLETILTISDMQEYMANPHREAFGTCLEAEQEGGRGVIAKLIVKNGTLRVGDVVLCGTSFGRVKALYDTLRTRTRVKAAGPAMPVDVTGFDVAPEAGDLFYVLPDIAQAREIANRRQSQSRAKSLSGTGGRVSFDDFQRRLSEGRLSQTQERIGLNLIVRADVRGSIEAIQNELVRLDHPEVQIKVLQASVGGITCADVTLASASEAVIVGFNVIPDDAARSLADERHVEIRSYNIIYKVTDDIKALLEGKLKPEERVVELGQALVKQVFAISRVGAIAGCYVVRGTIERGCRIRVNRDQRTIGDYPLESLRREKDDIKEVSRGMECGIKLAGFNDVKKDDILQAYKIEEVARTL